LDVVVTFLSSIVVLTPCEQFVSCATFTFSERNVRHICSSGSWRETVRDSLQRESVIFNDTVRRKSMYSRWQTNDICGMKLKRKYWEKIL